MGRKKSSAAAKARAEGAEAPRPDAPKGKKDKEKPKGLWGYVRSIGPAVLVALVIRAFLFEPFSIPSGSMLPTLEIGDYVIVTKFAYGVRIPFTNVMAWQAAQPDRGEIIVFEHPRRTGDNLIKRVVGLPGDEIRLLDGIVQVNGQPQPRELLQEAFAFDDYDERERRFYVRHGDLHVEKLVPRDGGARRHFVIQQREVEPPQGPYRVPEGHLFVLGDNRDNSADSREGEWYVPLGNVRGKASLIGFSWGDGKLRTDRLFRPIDAGVPQDP